MNKGHALRALNLFFLTLSDHNFKSVTLDVDPENETAIYLYKKLGFYFVGDEDKENMNQLWPMIKYLKS